MQGKLSKTQLRLQLKGLDRKVCVCHGAWRGVEMEMEMAKQVAG